MKANERDKKEVNAKLFSLVKVSFLKKSFVTAILVISVFAMFTAAVASAGDPPCTCGDICVNETGWWRAGGDFNASSAPIQHAIDNATEGNTICVKDGTYNENVDVNKRLTIRSENGSASTIVNAVDSADHVFDVSMDYVNISGLTVQKNGALCTTSVIGGIYLGNVNQCNISNNNVSYCYGIVLNNASSSRIKNNQLTISGLLDSVCISISNSSNNVITGNNAGPGCGQGIQLLGSNGNTITDNDVQWTFGDGIILWRSDNNTIAGNNASWGSQGIVLTDSSDNNTITNNIASHAWVGPGIWLDDGSANNTIIGNTASNNGGGGILLKDSSHNNLTNNTMAGNRGNNFFIDGYDLSHFIQNIDTSNTVDGRPIYYWINKQNQQVPDDAGFVGVVNSTNITVRDTNNYGGVLFAYTTNSRIENVNASIHGIYGIRLLFSSNNTLSNNTASNNEYGILLYYSSNNMLTNNTVSNSEYGILLEYSSNNILTGNSASNNEIAGLLLAGSSNNKLTNNNLSNNSECGIALEDSSNNILTNNTANSNKKVGIYLDFLKSSSNYNTLMNNTANSNDLYGIFLSGTSNNRTSNNSIYNNYFNNTDNARDDGNNIWNITKTLGTNIIGGPYLGGNYWSDYAGTDTDGDGLGDTQIPYNSSGNIANGGDYLPLVPVQKPTVSITTDKFSYKTGDTITITIDINIPTEDNVTFQWYWGVPQSDSWLLVTSVPIPAGYNDTINISFSIPNWGSTPSGSVFYVQLLDGSGEVLDADVAWWAYSPGRFMEAMSVDLSKEIAKIIEKVELPM